MDSTGGELGHAALKIESNVEKQSLSDQSSRENVLFDSGGVAEKPHADIHSSASSSDGIKPLEKLDSHIVKVGDVKDGDEAYAHLPPHEQEIVKRQLHIPAVAVNFFTLFRYASRKDLTIIAVSAFCAIAGGAITPLMTVGALSY